MTEVGCSGGGTRLVTCDLRTYLNLELGEECSRTLGPGMGWNLPEQLGLQVDGREQQSKRTRSGSSARNWSAAAEVDAIGEQQLKRTQIGKQQLCT